VLAKSARMLDRLFRPKHDYLPGTTIFRDIDIDLLTRELKLEELGERDGKGDLPHSDSQTETAAEKTIARQVRRYWDEAVQGARRAHETLSGRWTSLTSETEIDTLIGEPKAVSSTLLETARDDYAHLRSLHETVLAERKALEKFKARENLDRPLHQPKLPAFKWLIIVIAFAIELAINVSVFASGEEFGIAGALMKVIAIPVLNIGIAAALVFGLARNILRSSTGARIVGVLGMMATALWIFWFNLAIAHWRDSLAAAMSLEAGQLAVTSMLADPFHLISFNSWLLFGAGFAAGCLGAYDGWIWSDPYPGYARRVHALSAAESAYQHRRNWGVARLQSIAGSAIDQLRNAILKAETARARRPELASLAHGLQEDIAAYAGHLELVAEDLAIRYREANIRARSTAPPMRFDEPLTLGLAVPVLAPLGGGSQREVSGLLTSAIEQITTAKDSACARLPTLVEWSEAEPTI
jgi:hypothetical protein